MGGEGRRKAEGFITWLYAGCFPNISGFHTALKFNVPSTHCYLLASGDWDNLIAVKDKMGTPVAALIVLLSFLAHTLAHHVIEETGMLYF